MKHYIVTNRRIDQDRKGRMTITDCGHQAPATSLRFATYDTDSKEVEVLPDIHVSNEGDILDYTQKGGSIQFFDELFEQMKPSAGTKDLLVFVHGFANDKDDIKNNIQQLHEHYVSKSDDGKNIDTILLFAWTTNGELSLSDYKADAVDSEHAGVALARLYMKAVTFFNHFYKGIENLSCSRKVHLMCHSMGNLVLEQMISTLNGSKDYNLIKLFKEIILVAPDVPATVLEKQMPFSFLTELGQRVHVYTHQNDIALCLSEKINGGGSRLGNASIDDLPKLNQVYYIDAKPLNKGVWQGLKDEIIQHWYHFKSDNVIKDINLVLNGKGSDEIPSENYIEQATKDIIV